MNDWLKTLGRSGIAGLLALSLSACVTTTSTPQNKVDDEKIEKTHVTAGFAYLSKSKPEKDYARRHFMKALEYNKNSAGALNGMALIYQMEEEWELAESYFRKSLSADKSFTQARTNYAAFLFVRERYSEAQDELKIVLEDVNYDKRYLALLNMALVQIKLGQPDEALQTLRQAVGVNFRLPRAHLELSQLYFDKRDFTQSKFYYDHYVKMARQTARSLWLGIQLERIFGNKDKEASYAMALKNLYPYSQEYLHFKASTGE